MSHPPAIPSTSAMHMHKAESPFADTVAAAASVSVSPDSAKGLSPSMQEGRGQKLDDAYLNVTDRGLLAEAEEHAPGYNSRAGGEQHEDAALEDSLAWPRHNQRAPCPQEVGQVQA
ncbi:hypothetical protein ACLMJK_009549 [Lecanora helva]